MHPPAVPDEKTDASKRLAAHQPTADGSLASNIAPGVNTATLRVLFAGVRRHGEELMREMRAGAFQLIIRQAYSEEELKRRLYPRPDLIVADCADEDLCALRVLSLLQAQGAHPPVLVIANPDDEATAMLCLEQGAADYIDADRPARVVPVVRRILAEGVARAGHSIAEQRLREEADRLGAIVDTQHQIATSGLDLHAVMSIITKRSQWLTRADGAAVELLEGTETVQLAACGAATKSAGMRRPLAGTISGQCVRSRQIIRSDDMEGELQADFETGRHAGVKSLIAVPLFREQAVVGVLKVMSGTVSAFDDSDVKLLDLVAGILSSAMSNALDFESKQALVSEKTAALEALRESEHRFRALIERSPVGICIVDEHRKFEIVNLAFASMFAYDPVEIIGMHYGLVVPIHLRAESYAQVDDTIERNTDQTIELQLVDKHGAHITVLATTIALKGADGRPKVATFVVDISERKRVEQHLAHVAHHDSLTSLPNRLLFNDRVAQALRSAQRNTSSVALLLVDLNHFKEINDTLGHAAGDQLLQQVSARMQETLRGSDTVARLGGDEFAVLLPMQGGSGAVRVANKIIHNIFSEPVILNDRTLEIDGSIGIAVFPEHGDDAATLMRHADIAMYTAKAAGGGYAIYAAEHDQHSSTRLQLSGELRQAISGQQLRLYYQPIVDCRTMRFTRVEALVRWQHPVHGLLAPDRFVPLAEQSGLITLLTLWVLEEALRQCQAWRETGMDLGVAVNVSMRTIQESQFPDLVRALLRQYRIPAEHLTLEVTESMLMVQPDQTLAVLQALNEIGTRISIDDFGTGHSSLSYLKRLPVHELKLDRSFVQNLITEHDASIVSFIVGLGGALDRAVVVEGVETEQMLGWLVNLGCETVQGYYISRPVTPEALTAWARESSWRVQAIVSSDTRQGIYTNREPTLS